MGYLDERILNANGIMFPGGIGYDRIYLYFHISVIFRILTRYV